MAWVRERTKPSNRCLSVKLMPTIDQRDGSLWPYSRIFRPVLAPVLSFLIWGSYAGLLTTSLCLYRWRQTGKVSWNEVATHTPFFQHIPYEKYQRTGSKDPRNIWNDGSNYGLSKFHFFNCWNKTTFRERNKQLHQFCTDKYIYIYISTERWANECEDRQKDTFYFKYINQDRQKDKQTKNKRTKGWMDW
jgi:hypothetical protein